MEYITATEFRTRMRWLIAILKQGKSVHWIHHSKIIAVIVPKQVT